MHLKKPTDRFLLSSFAENICVSMMGQFRADESVITLPAVDFSGFQNSLSDIVFSFGICVVSFFSLHNYQLLISFDCIKPYKRGTILTESVSKSAVCYQKGGK